MDAKQRYHQISVWRCDIEKLAFFAPNNKKYAFKILPFRPVNSPTFYACMMVNFREKWDNVFLESTALAASGSTLNGEFVSTNGTTILVEGIALHSGTKSTINDILI